MTVVMLKTHGVYLRPHSVSEPLQARCCSLIRPTYCGTIVCAAPITGPTGSNMCTAPFVWLICWPTAALEEEKNKKKNKKLGFKVANPGAAATLHPFTATAAAACLPVDRCSFWQPIYHYDKCNTSTYPYIQELKNEPS